MRDRLPARPGRTNPVREARPLGSSRALLAHRLRAWRTLAYRIASPLERLFRADPELPPLWLRRHAGAVSKYRTAADQMAALIDAIGALEPEDAVLDIGCGPGTMTAYFARRIAADGRYVGFDVHRSSISWCRRRFAADPRLRFELARIRSPYGSREGAPIDQYRFPMEDGTAGFVLAKSVFTHLLESDARHYLSEIRRTLRPGRGAVVSTFLFDAASRAAEEVRKACPFSAGDGRVRWRSSWRPESAVVYDQDRFHAMVEDSGLHVQWMSAGFWPGKSDLGVGQDVLLLGH